MTERHYNSPAAIQAMMGGDFQNAIVAATPGGIERQEAAGQQALVSNFAGLPLDMGDGGWDVAKRLGFVRGEPEDDIFVKVTAPVGWRLSATPHSMHNDILDDQGRKRGSIFYKAAFYDRRADGHWTTRYSIADVGRGELREGGYRAFDPSRLEVTDVASGEVLWHGEDRSSPEATGGTPEGRAAWDAYRAQQTADRDAALAFLAERFPDWRDPAAYW